MKSKQILFGLILLIFLLLGCVNNSRKVDNLYTFAKVYGYVRWFYPGDEAAEVDWNKFAVYGIKKVENARNQKELKNILLRLFTPIAPALKIEDKSQVESFDLRSIIPDDTTDFKTVSWEHYGVYLGDRSNIYQSIRTNRVSKKRWGFNYQNNLKNPY